MRVPLKCFAVGISAIAQCQYNHICIEAGKSLLTLNCIKHQWQHAELCRIAKCFDSISGCVPQIHHLYPYHETVAGMQPRCATGT